MANGIGQQVISGIGQAQTQERGRTSNALADLALEQRKQQIATGQQQQGVSGELQKLKFMNNAAKSLINVPPQQRAAAFQKLEPLAERVGIQPGSFTADQLTDENLTQLINSTSQFLQNPQALTAKIQEQQSDFKILEGAVDANGQLKPAEQLTAEQLAVARKLALIARPVGSGAATIATTPGLTQQVAGSQQVIKGAEETGKLEAQLDLKSQIVEKVKLAEVQAKARGEVLTTLNRAKAALPGLQEVTTKLKQLADVATFTTTGKVVNVLARELFGISTEGGTARTTMRSVVDNQVLPLLRDTFGAAFTKAEGDSLRNTLLDPDTTPDEMKATLDSFIEQKIRNIETGEREVGVGPEPSSQEFQEGQTATNSVGQKVIFQNGQWVPFNG